MEFLVIIKNSYGSVRNYKCGRNMQCWQTRSEWDNEAINCWVLCSKWKDGHLYDQNSTATVKCISYFFSRRVNFCLIIVLFKQNRIHSFTIIHLVWSNFRRWFTVQSCFIATFISHFGWYQRAYSQYCSWARLKCASPQHWSFVTLWQWTTLWSCLERQSWTKLCVELLNQHQNLFWGCPFQVCNNAQ